MKYLFALLFTSTVLTLASQNLDSRYYLFGLSFDYTIPTYSNKNIERQKINTSVHENNLEKMFRLSEVTGKSYKRRRKRRGCSNCHEFFELKNVQYPLGYFYEFSSIKERGVRPKRVIGKIKNEVIDNATEKEVKSFLAGVYNRYGTMSGDTVVFQFGHVNEKLELIQRFIKSLDGAEFMNTVHLEKGMIGGGPKMLIIPKGDLKNTFLTEQIRIVELAKKANNLH
ncbi:hypothetical protein GYB57_12290 [bacterium]|nr:hypothetical protein [bacterium]